MSRTAPLLLALVAVLLVGMAATALDGAETAPELGEGTFVDDTDVQQPVTGGGAETPGTETATEIPTAGDVPAQADGDGRETGSPPLWQVALGLVVFVVAGGLGVYLLTGDEDPSDETPNPESVPTVDRSAERERLVSDAPTSNDVYRAWDTLRRRVDADSSSSPATVAERAIEAGYPRQPVADLTDCYCAVRFGDADPTQARERRARRALAALDDASTDEVREGSPDSVPGPEVER